MNFEYSEKVSGLIESVREFMDEHIYPNEALFEQQVADAPWETAEIVTELKKKCGVTPARVGSVIGFAPRRRQRPGHE